MPSVWDSLADMRVRIDDYSTERRELQVSPEFARITTTVVLHGDGEVGQGEDITYTSSDHEHFPDDVMLAGTWTLDEYSRHLDELELWNDEPVMEASVDYRRWAFESAALDLALRQAHVSLADMAERPFRPVRFVASTRRDIAPYRALDPGLEFKLDVDQDWDRELMQGLAATERIRVLDLKAYYRGTSVDLAPDPAQYRLVAETFPDVVIEDAWLEDGCREALSGAEQRLSFDAPIHSWSDVTSLPLEPRWLNIKPSRFGTVQRLCECIEQCEANDIAMYGGGQFELGPGRLQIQRLASVFYADGPNDVAPSVYNEGPPHEGMPRSPLPAPEGAGL